MESVSFEALKSLFLIYGVNVIFFLLGVAATFIVANWAAKATFLAIHKSKLDDTLGLFLSKLSRWTVIVLGIVSCLGILGVQTASFAAILAGAGLAIGMALQGTLGNFAAGVMLLLFRPFKVGDVVNVAGQAGSVTAIDIFNTILDTPDNRRIIVPNGNVFGNQIENISFHKTRRVDVSIGSEYTADLDQTRSVLEKAAKSVKNLLSNPEPVVVLNELGDSSINWSVRVWVNTENFWTVKDELTRALKYALDEAQISIPFPQMDLHLSPESLENIRKH